MQICWLGGFLLCNWCIYQGEGVEKVGFPFFVLQSVCGLIYLSLPYLWPVFYKLMIRWCFQKSSFDLYFLSYFLLSSFVWCLWYFKTPSIVLLQAYVRPLFGRPIPCYVIKPQAWLNSLGVLFTYCCISLWLPFLPSCLFLYSSFVFSSSSPLYLAFSLFFHFSFLISYLFSFLRLPSLLI